MRVKELTAWQVRVPLKKPIQHASHTRTDTDNVVVRCVLDDGTEGFGEGEKHQERGLRNSETSWLTPALLAFCGTCLPKYPYKTK